MCLFRKKSKVNTSFPHLYSLGDCVKFKYRGEVTTGYIYGYSLGNDGNVIYDIQLGGECPIIVNNVKEETIFIPKKQ